MPYQYPSQPADILLAIQQLSPGERRQLLRRLHAGGLLEQDELLSDQRRLDVAPALGKRIAQWRTAKTSETAVPPSDAPTSVAEESDVPEQAEKNVADAIVAGQAAYHSPISGKVVVGPPSDVDAEDPHAMRPVPGQAPEQPIVIIFDGGSKGNPGRGYGSFALRWPGQTQQIVQLQFGDNVTNNEAEYDTLIAALEAVLARLADLGADAGTAQLTVYGDSLLVINQVKDEWRCKEQRLQLRRDEVRGQLAQFGRWLLLHHDRSKSVEVLGH